MTVNATIEASFIKEIDTTCDHDGGRWRVHHGKGPWWDELTDGVDIEQERDDCYYIYEWPSGKIYAIIPAMHPDIFTPEVALRQFLASRDLVGAINQMVYDAGDRF
jgi:hypothetical protein